MTAQEPALYAEPWRAEAACIGEDVELFFPVKGGNVAEQRHQIRAAKAICAGCPVAGDCLAFAVEQHEQHGIFGGLTPRERRPKGGDRSCRCALCGEPFRAPGGARYCSAGCRSIAAASVKRDHMRRVRST